MRTRNPVQVMGVRDAIPGSNFHELALELFRTIDDAAMGVGNTVDSAGDQIAKALASMEARLETMEDALRRINSALKELGPI